MKEKGHICDRMVQIIEESGISVAQFENKANEKGLKLTQGYLRKAAKNDTNIGIDLVEYFLGQYTDIDPFWLITGNGVSRNTDKNHTAVPKEFEELRKDLETFRILSVSQAQTILNLSSARTTQDTQ